MIHLLSATYFHDAWRQVPGVQRLIRAFVKDVKGLEQFNEGRVDVNHRSRLIHFLTQSIRCSEGLFAIAANIHGVLIGVPATSLRGSDASPASTTRGPAYLPDQRIHVGRSSRAERVVYPACEEHRLTSAETPRGLFAFAPVSICVTCLIQFLEVEIVRVGLQMRYLTAM